MEADCHPDAKCSPNGKKQTTTHTRHVNEVSMLGVFCTFIHRSLSMIWVSNIVQTTVYKKQREAKSKCLVDDPSTWADSMSNRPTWLPFKQCSPLHCRNHSINPRANVGHSPLPVSETLNTTFHIFHIFPDQRGTVLCNAKILIQISWWFRISGSIVVVSKRLTSVPYNCSITVISLLYHYLLFPHRDCFIYKDTPWGRSSELQPQLTNRGRQTTTSWSPTSPVPSLRAEVCAKGSSARQVTWIGKWWEKVEMKWVAFKTLMTLYWLVSRDSYNGVS